VLVVHAVLKGGPRGCRGCFGEGSGLAPTGCRFGHLWRWWLICGWYHLWIMNMMILL